MIKNLVVKSLMMDKNAKKKVGLNFAILLVELKIGSQLSNKKYFQERNLNNNRSENGL